MYIPKNKSDRRQQDMPSWNISSLRLDHKHYRKVSVQVMNVNCKSHGYCE